MPSGRIDREMTGSGTNIEFCSRGQQGSTIRRERLTIENVLVPSVKVSPDEHSTPNMAQISPGPIESTSYSKVSSSRCAFEPTHLHLVTVHSHQPRHLDLLPCPRIVDQSTTLQRTLVDPHIRELAITSFFQLEGETDERCLSGRHQGYWRGSSRKRGVECLRGCFGGVGQVGTHAV